MALCACGVMMGDMVVYVGAVLLAAHLDMTTLCNVCVMIPMVALMSLGDGKRGERLSRGVSADGVVRKFSANRWKTLILRSYGVGDTSFKQSLPTGITQASDHDDPGGGQLT